MVSTIQSVYVQCGRLKPYLFVSIVTKGDHWPDISTALIGISLVVFFSARNTIGHFV